jgi:hypothetical protein
MRLFLAEWQPGDSGTSVNLSDSASTINTRSPSSDTGFDTACERYYGHRPLVRLAWHPSQRRAATETRWRRFSRRGASSITTIKEFPRLRQRKTAKTAPGRASLRRLVGDDFFRTARSVAPRSEPEPSSQPPSANDFTRGQKKIPVAHKIGLTRYGTYVYYKPRKPLRTCGPFFYNLLATQKRFPRPFLAAGRAAQRPRQMSAKSRSGLLAPAK